MEKMGSQGGCRLGWGGDRGSFFLICQIKSNVEVLSDSNSFCGYGISGSRVSEKFKRRSVAF